MSGCGKQEDINNQNQNAEQLLQENQTQEIENKEELSEIENKEQIEENLEEIFQDENGEMMKRKKITSKFSIVYPADWFWVDADMQFGGYITNNKNITDINSKNLNDFNDVILTVSSAPIAPFSEEISTDMVERLKYEVKRNVEFSIEQSQNLSCDEIINSEFEIEYECQGNVNEIYYCSKKIGIKYDQISYGAAKYSISAKSKNPELVKKFSIEKNY